MHLTFRPPPQLILNAISAIEVIAIIPFKSPNLTRIFQLMLLINYRYWMQDTYIFVARKVIRTDLGSRVHENYMALCKQILLKNEKYFLRVLTTERNITDHRLLDLRSVSLSV